ncbi:MAG: CYTH domain-containing protein [Alcaligenaceae bacterium]|nr:CYTH domain-containing protein [Alcaligenaceae bacterium]
MSVEQELKLHVLKESRQAVKAIVDTAEAETIHLHAYYFDTHDRELAKAGIALRLRKEPEGWIQTIKLPGADALSKIELNHHRPDATLDLGVYISTPAESTFTQLKSPLLSRFETDIYRTLRLQNTAHGLIELAYDVGVIRSDALEIPVCEIEFELKEGEPAAIFELAEAWQAQHGFLLDFRSKAERGDALAHEAIALAAQSKSDDHLNINTIFKEFKLWQAFQDDGAEFNDLDKTNHHLKKHSQTYLEQIARNAAIIAGIERSDMSIKADFDCSEHIYHLCRGLHKMSLLWSAFRATETIIAPPQELLHTLNTYQEKFSKLSLASPYATGNDDCLDPAMQTKAARQASKLSASADFQQYLLKVLAWTILD